MTRKSLGTCVLLLGLLLGTSSAAYADAFVITSVSLSSLQIVPASGTIVFSPPQVGSRTFAGAAATTGFDEESGQQSEGPTLSQANASVAHASVSAVSDFTNLFLNANNTITLSGCLCSAETEGDAFLKESFIITGGSGNVVVNFSALLDAVQNVVTDQFSLFAASRARFSLQVVDVQTFSFDSILHIGPNDLANLETQRQLSEAITLQFGHQYDLVVFVGASSEAAQNEVPEPATVVLLGSGLGFMAGFVRKRRAMLH